MELRALLVCALCAAARASPAPAPAPAGGRLVTLADEPARPEDLVAGVRHPTPPIFRVDERGWPVQGDSGLVALADGGEGFVYATRRLEEWGVGRATGTTGLENWGQIEVFACLARALREYRARLPEGPPIPIGHISGEHGGFPDLRGTGYSDHLTHQTGLHVNVLLPPAPGVQERVAAVPDTTPRFEREALLVFLDAVLRHGANQLVTNVEVVALDDAPEVELPSLRELLRRPAQESPWNRVFHRRTDGVSIGLFLDTGNHADHCNVAFSPRE